MKLTKNEERLLKALYELRGGFGLFSDLKRIVNLADIKKTCSDLARKDLAIVKQDLDDLKKPYNIYCLTVEGYILSSLQKNRKKEMFLKDLKFSLPWYKAAGTRDNPIIAGIVTLEKRGLIKIEFRQEETTDTSYQPFIIYIIN
jgi:hypothetical protein